MNRGGYYGGLVRRDVKYIKAFEAGWNHVVPTYNIRRFPSV